VEPPDAPLALSKCPPLESLNCQDSLASQPVVGDGARATGEIIRYSDDGGLYARPDRSIIIGARFYAARLHLV
jgi:hypothetical protein